MKRISIVALCVMGGLFLVEDRAHGQAVMAGDEMFIEMLKHDVDQTRREVIGSVMEFSADDKALFWPVYNEYRKKSEALTKKDLALMKEYAAAYWSLTDEQAREIAGRWIELEVARKKLYGELFGELSKVLSPVQAFKVTQLENRLDLIVDMQIVNELPMVE